MSGFVIRRRIDVPGADNPQLAVALGPELYDRIQQVAAARSQSPAETLSAALDALEHAATLVRPIVSETPLAPDGQPYCKCPGPEEAGPWHGQGCHRRTGG